MFDEQVDKHFKSLQRTSTILYGIEAHVCVRQTAMDLLERGHDVHLVVDACSSMNWHDRAIALRSMSDAGVTMISFQSLVFEMLRSVDNPSFKATLGVVKANPQVPLDWDMSDAKL